MGLYPGGTLGLLNLLPEGFPALHFLLVVLAHLAVRLQEYSRQ